MLPGGRSGFRVTNGDTRAVTLCMRTMRDLAFRPPGQLAAAAPYKLMKRRGKPSRASPSTTCEVPSQRTAGEGSFQGGFWIRSMGQALACVDADGFAKLAGAATR